MSAALRIVSAGPGCTVQDAGRVGFVRFGVTGAGPMDRLAHATAKLALGNAPGAAAIEISMGGIEVAADGAPLAVALAGGAFDVATDGMKLPAAVRLDLVPGQALAARAGAAGAWCYLAVAGAKALPRYLGSLSTHTRSGLGGLEGRALQAGDRLALEGARALGTPPQRILAPWLDRPAETIRVVLGPQDDFFDAAEIARFAAGPWSLSPRSDRMAFRLDGLRIKHARGHDIVSDGIAMGAIQIPGDGQPLLMMADRGSTGGYPKIATVIGPDLGRLAQLRAGKAFRFEIVDVETAVEARRAEARALAAPLGIEPVVRTEFPSEFLLARNLIDGAVAR